MEWILFLAYLTVAGTFFYEINKTGEKHIFILLSSIFWPVVFVLVIVASILDWLLN